MAQTLKSIVEKNGLSNNAGQTSEKLLQFRRSFTSVMDPPRRYYVLCLRGRV
jgi:hypothetical protein